MPKALITTVPFADKSRDPINMLESAGIDYLINPLNKKLTEDQLVEMVADFDVIIAGTEPITKKVFKNATNLKMISRVGIGLDSVDLLAAEDHGIKVSYTPDAPAPAVAELTLGMILTLLRSVHVSNAQMHNGEWERIFGRRLSKSTLGIVGLGRIGSGLLHLLKGFDLPKILVNDIKPEHSFELGGQVDFVSKEQIFKEADVISLHVPLTRSTKNMICREQLFSMKEDAIVINTSRGGIINEKDLYDVMMEGRLAGAAIDVFDNEPYSGNLSEIERCLLTSHMGSMSIDCRTRMEIEATEEALRFLIESRQESAVPLEEYDVQREGL